VENGESGGVVDDKLLEEGGMGRVWRSLGASGDSGFSGVWQGGKEEARGGGFPQWQKAVVIGLVWHGGLETIDEAISQSKS